MKIIKNFNFFNFSNLEVGQRCVALTVKFSSPEAHLLSDQSIIFFLGGKIGSGTIELLVLIEKLNFRISGHRFPVRQSGRNIPKSSNLLFETELYESWPRVSPPPNTCVSMENLRILGARERRRRILELNFRNFEFCQKILEFAFFSIFGSPRS